MNRKYLFIYLSQLFIRSGCERADGREVKETEKKEEEGKAKEIIQLEEKKERESKEYFFCTHVRLDIL